MGNFLPTKVQLHFVADGHVVIHRDLGGHACIGDGIIDKRWNAAGCGQAFIDVFGAGIRIVATGNQALDLDGCRIGRTLSAPDGGNGDVMQGMLAIGMLEDLLWRHRQGDDAAFEVVRVDGDTGDELVFPVQVNLIVSKIVPGDSTTCTCAWIVEVLPIEAAVACGGRDARGAER